MDQRSVCLAERSQGEANGFFTLTNFQVSVQKVKISSTCKTCDKSDIPYSQCGSLDLSILYHSLHIMCGNPG
jgi:hypothetical protein